MMHTQQRWNMWRLLNMMQLVCVVKVISEPPSTTHLLCPVPYGSSQNQLEMLLVLLKVGMILEGMCGAWKEVNGQMHGHVSFCNRLELKVQHVFLTTMEWKINILFLDPYVEVIEEYDAASVIKFYRRTVDNTVMP